MLLVNACALYHSVHLLIWKTDKKKIMTQYQFQEDIVFVCAWLDGEKEENEMQKKQKQPGCQVSSISSDSGEVRGST